MRYAHKSEIIFSEIVDFIFYILFFEIFSVIGEIIHRNGFGFYGLFLCMIINLILLIKTQTLGRFFLNIYLLDEEEKELKFSTVFKKEFLEIVLFLTIVLYIVNVSYMFLKGYKNQTIITKKLGIIYCTKEQGENYEINSRIRKSGN